MIRKVIESKELVKKLQENSTVYDSEEILGTMPIVQEFAIFNGKHNIDLQVAKAFFLLDYCETQVYNFEQVMAFKTGLECMFKLFETSEEDFKQYLRDAQEKNKKTK